jgi:predicted Zn-dependent protease with MMP-like domain
MQAPTRGPYDELLDQAESAMAEGRFEDAEASCRSVLALAPRHAEAHYLLGESLRDQGRLEEAEGAYRFLALNGAEDSPLLSSAWSALAAVLTDQLRWEEASKAANRALREDHHNGEAAWVRGILRERRGDYSGASRDFSRAWRLDPDGYPLPVPLDDATVEKVVQECLEELHPNLRQYLSNVAIVLEEIPSEELLRHFDPPAYPTQILGFFSGASLMERSLWDPWSNLPGAIVLFRRNLERFAHDRASLLEELRITLFHEVGHFLGLGEDDLEDRGLD